MQTMLETSGFGRKTLERVLTALANDNLIDRQPGRGIFKLEPKAKFARKNLSVIDVIFSRNLDLIGPYFTELMSVLSMEATRRGYSIRGHFFEEETAAKECSRFLESTFVSACLVMSLSDAMIASLLDNHHVPWVAVLPQIPVKHERVILDSPKMIELQMNHLFSLGHKKIAIFTSTDEGIEQLVVQQKRLSDYYRFMAEKGYQVMPEWVAPVGIDEKKVFKALRRIFSSENKPTAAIVNDISIPTVYRFIEGMGWKIGKDFSVIGTDDLKMVSSMIPGPTTVRNSRGRTVNTAIHMLEDMLSGHLESSTKYTELELIIRESTGPAPKSDT